MIVSNIRTVRIKNEVKHDCTLQISLMYRRINLWQKIEPYGTPHAILCKPDLFPLNCT